MKPDLTLPLSSVAVQHMRAFKVQVRLDCANQSKNKPASSLLSSTAVISIEFEKKIFSDDAIGIPVGDFADFF